MRPTLNTITVPIRRIRGEDTEFTQDLLAVEEPLEIRIDSRNLAITMRTPGHDFELTAGFLFSEGILEDRSQIASIEWAGDPKANIVNVALTPGVELDLSRTERNFYMTSSCGVCGKASIQMLECCCPVLPQHGLQVPPEVLHGLPDTLGKAQPVFGRTGGLHAAALFDVAGSLQSLREDVGRHNALDKLIGAEFLAGRLPLHDRILLVSGRASFELVQKAVMAGIPLMAAVGAPSSLAVRTALRFGMTLLGFVRNGRFNIYSGENRLTLPR
jgi:FdhD protein